MPEIPAIVETDSNGKIQKVKITRKAKIKNDKIGTTSPQKVIKELKQPIIQTFKENKKFRRQILRGVHNSEISKTKQLVAELVRSMD